VTGIAVVENSINLMSSYMSRERHEQRSFSTTTVILINRHETAFLDMLGCLHTTLKENTGTFAWTGRGLLEVVQKLTVWYLQASTPSAVSIATFLHNIQL
jgi:hypothetical protein